MKDPLNLKPEEFELHVAKWLKAAGKHLGKIQVEHRKTVAGLDGNYEIDVLVTFEALEGAHFLIVVECKRYRERVKRDTLIPLKDKKSSLGAQKAMMFATGGFQSGAVEYAKAHGIALVEVKDSGFSYIQKSVDGKREYSPVPEGWLVSNDDATGEAVQHLVSVDENEALARFLQGE